MKMPSKDPRVTLGGCKLDEGLILASSPLTFQAIGADDGDGGGGSSGA